MLKGKGSKDGGTFWTAIATVQSCCVSKCQAQTHITAVFCTQELVAGDITMGTDKQSGPGQRDSRPPKCTGSCGGLTDYPTMRSHL